MKIFLLLLLLGCDDATTVVVDNGYSDSTIVDAVWWSQTEIPDRVAAGAESPAYRTVPATATAYALLERDGNVFVAETTAPLTVDRSATLHVTISPTTIVGDCATSTLTQAQADLITQSIFPGKFDGAIYDASTCKLFKPELDAGAD